MEVGIEISNSRRAGLKFEQFPEQARQGLERSITSATERLEAIAKGLAPKRTGRLASEITSRVVSGDRYITGIVGIRGETPNDFAKAAAEEYGAHGTAQVKSHSAKLDHLFNQPIASISVMVEAHSRKLNIASKNYLRNALEEVRGEAMAAMHDAIQQAATA